MERVDEYGYAVIFAAVMGVFWGGVASLFSVTVGLVLGVVLFLVSLLIFASLLAISDHPLDAGEDYYES